MEREEVPNMTGAQGRAGIPSDNLDPEIRELVRVLNDLSFLTHHSCSGHRGKPDHLHHSRYAEVGFDVRGLGELHRFVTIANAADRKLQKKHREICFEVALNWSSEVLFFLDPDEPERLPLVLQVKELTEEGDDTAPTPEQIALLAGAFRRAGGAVAVPGI